MSDLIDQALLDAANDMIFVHRFDVDGAPGNFLHVNELACSRLEYSREELLGLSPRDLTAEDQRKAISSQVQRLMQDRRHVFENVLMTKSGKAIPVEISASIVDRNGVDTAISFVRDITERVEAEEALAESERRLRTLTEATPAYLYELDQEGRIRFVNRTYPALTPKDVLGTYLTDWYSPELKPRIAELIQKAFETGDAQSIEYTLPDLQGIPISYVAKIGPTVETKHGPVAFLTAVECQPRESSPATS